MLRISLQRIFCLKGLCDIMVIQKHFELDNQLKVPETIWNSLYKFQKTGVKWLWELHKQRCGGILGMRAIFVFFGN